MKKQASILYQKHKDFMRIGGKISYDQFIPYRPIMKA